LALGLVASKLDAGGKLGKHFAKPTTKYNNNNTRKKQKLYSGLRSYSECEFSPCNFTRAQLLPAAVPLASVCYAVIGRQLSKAAVTPHPSLSIAAAVHTDDHNNKIVIIITYCVKMYIFFLYRVSCTYCSKPNTIHTSYTIIRENGAILLFTTYTYASRLRHSKHQCQ